jgi:hypothetical protein
VKIIRQELISLTVYNKKCFILFYLGNYGREIREIFQQIEDPEERAKLRRARRAQMQRKF